MFYNLGFLVFASQVVLGGTFFINQKNNPEQIPIELRQEEMLERIFLSGNPFILKRTDLEDFQKLIDELAKKDVRVFF